MLNTESVKRILVEKRQGFDLEAKALKKDLLENLHIDTIEDIRVLNRYDIEVISDEAYDKGVLVVLNDNVLLASEATKTNTLALDTFKSLTFGPLGIVDGDHLILTRNIVNKQFIDTDEVVSEVALIKSGIGMDETFIKFAADQGFKGIVIEAMGRGNIPPGMLKGVEYARSKDIPVVITTRCHSGRVFDSYGYLGSGRDLRNLGCIFAGELPGQKARIKLMLSLGKTNDLNEIKDIFEEGIYY